MQRSARGQGRARPRSPERAEPAPRPIMKARQPENQMPSAQAPARIPPESKSSQKPVNPIHRSAPETSISRPAIQRPVTATHSPASTAPEPQTDMSRPIMGGSAALSVPVETKFLVKNMPPGWGTLDVHRMMENHGSVSRIEILRPRSRDQTAAYVTLALTKSAEAFARQGITISHKGRPRLVRLVVTAQNNGRQNSRSTDRGKLKVAAEAIVFGAAKDEETFLELERCDALESAPITIGLDLKFKCLELVFQVAFPSPKNSAEDEPRSGTFIMRLNFPQISGITVLQSQEGHRAFLIKTSAPPVVFRKSDDLGSSHEDGADTWLEEQALLRQTSIRVNTNDLDGPTELRDRGCLIDLGRWLAYRVEISRNIATSEAYKDLVNTLDEHDLLSDAISVPNFVVSSKEALSEGLNKLTHSGANSKGTSSSAFADLHQMQHEGINLSFEVRYVLEACISFGVIHESNVDAEFLDKLAAMEPPRASKLLEAALDKGDEDHKHTFHRPADIFRLLPKLPLAKHKVPSYCCQIRSATVTPTTIYFNAPVLETSNRVVRKFQEHEDRFLRVRFSDELYRRKLYAGEGNKMDEVYARIRHTMNNGIKVGDRTYKFLACGNSQFREGGAYFFASTPSCSAASIRAWMGDFTRISNVAKYCSRLGQSFSTTRALSIGVRIEKIDDIERNGFNFTDGVGKISPFLAQMIAQQYGLLYSTMDFPSAFQFRLAGCKGVLVVAPELAGTTIQIRPSQEKYPAHHLGLEICRISQFSAANLNVQLILVLSALGIPDKVFLEKMRAMLRDLEKAMDDEQMALDLLQKNIDFNHMTITLAEIIQDGFMQVKDPFVISLLHLWRSWSIKYLREKARIFIEEGAFVLGCIDETASLRGHFNDAVQRARPEDPESMLHSLPQVFLQIPDPAQKGKWKIITGLCVVARNPSLHPGDVRVVQAVDEPKLHHIKNAVVFPQTGDRDVPNMLSGGDLDGDDFIVIWDPDLLPTRWNVDPMDFSPPKPPQPQGAVTVEMMTSFFVTHMQYDNLSRIAVAHRYLADASDEGINDPKCLKLAELHSRAVDFQKTGVPADYPRHLRPEKWPHWAGVRKSRTYISEKVIGQLYDAAKHTPFEAAWELSFDARVLEAYEHSDETLMAVREVKAQYDSAVARLMAKYGIESEFEIWSTFVMHHNNDIGDYKFAETIGESVNALKHYHKTLCYEAAGTNEKERDREKLYPFVAAMYVVTAREMADALKECEEEKQVGERVVRKREKKFKSMPFLSFPWLFPESLGKIAKKQGGNPTITAGIAISKPKPKSSGAANSMKHILGEDFELAPLPEIVTEEGDVRGGELLDLFHQEDVTSDPASEMGPLSALISAEFSPTSASQAPSADKDAQNSKTTEQMLREDVIRGDENADPRAPTKLSTDDSDERTYHEACADQGIVDMAEEQASPSGEPTSLDTSPPPEARRGPSSPLKSPQGQTTSLSGLSDIQNSPAVELAHRRLRESFPSQLPPAKDDTEHTANLEELEASYEVTISSKPGATLDQFDALFDDDSEDD